MGFQHMYSLCRLSLFTSHNINFSTQTPEDESDRVYRTEGITAAWSSPSIEMDQIPKERGGTEQKKVFLH